MTDTTHPPREDVSALVRHIEALLDLPRFRKPNLLIRALTHWSFVRDVVPDMGHNERFEFHGDQHLKRSFQRYFRDAPYAPEVRRRLENVALSNGYLGAYAIQASILEAGMFGPSFKRMLAAQPNGASARLIAADLLEALLYAIWRDQGFEQMHAYASRVLWEHAAKIPLEHLEPKDGKISVPVDGVVINISIDQMDRKLTRMGFPNARVSHMVLVELPDASFVYGKGTSMERAYQQLIRKLGGDSFSRSPHEQK